MIKSKPATDAYRTGWDRVFGLKVKTNARCPKGGVYIATELAEFCTCSGFWPHDADCPEGIDHGPR